MGNRSTNPCQRCHQDHPKCRAHTKTGKPCMMNPAAFAAVCRKHGGEAPQVQAMVERRRNEATAAAAVVTYGLPREVAPDVALLEEVHRTAGHVAWLGQLVQYAETEDLTQVNDLGVEVQSVWIDMYARERTHLVAVSKAAIAAGIAERQVKVAEQQGQLLASAVKRILDALDLTPDQLAKVPEVVPAVLRSLEQGAA